MLSRGRRAQPGGGPKEAGRMGAAAPSADRPAKGCLRTAGGPGPLAAQRPSN